MANLAIVGSHSTNGVAAIHSRAAADARRCRTSPSMFPERFNNKTNGVTPRRWLLLANPDARRGCITEAIGDGWVTDLAELREARRRWPTTRASATLSARRSGQAKARFADWLKATAGMAVDPDSIFDSQIKRIHEYKRQLLNVLHVVVLYNRLRDEPGPRRCRRGRSSSPARRRPAYHLAKLIIKLINNVGRHDRRRPGGARPAQGRVPARTTPSRWPSG